MATHYLSEALTRDDAVLGGTVTVTGDEARHAVQVSRVRPGEVVSVGDGAGLVVRGPVVSADRDALVVEVAERHEVPAPAPRITLVQALAKGDRDELAVQAATELGVAAVVPWQAERSVSIWKGEKREKGVARWRTIVREAAKQSLRPWVPEVRAIVSTAELATPVDGVLTLVLEPSAGRALTSVPLDAREIRLVVGPEGGIAPGELDRLTASGAQVVRLGDEVLRTSTAGPAAIAALAVRLGRW